MAQDEERDNRDGDEVEVKCPECPVCVPGLPMWMATFSDMCTLLLTFFILLISFAKFEDSKAKSVTGSIQDAFGGNALQQGEVVMQGRSNDNSPSLLDSQSPPKPFPIEFMTMEGLLDKHEMNRETTETLNDMKADLAEFDLAASVDIYESAQGVSVRFRDRIYFQKGSIKIEEMEIDSFQKMINLVIVKNWTLFVEGHSDLGERSTDGSKDALMLSSLRAAAVTKSLIQRGVRPDRISTVFYGDSRPQKAVGLEKEKAMQINRRVEFMIRKSDLRSEGIKVP